MAERRGAILEADGLHQVYRQPGRDTVALDGVSFAVREREFVSVVGPSGCGKSTLLRCLSGLMTPTGGAARFRGQEVREPPSAAVLVFQDYGRALFPWRTVLSNVLFARERNGGARAPNLAAAQAALAAVSLADFGEYYPWELSGGMQQRVQIARALAYEPDLFLMDEPFASLDALTRTDLEDQLLSIWDHFGKTILFVTHDIEEAIYLSDRVIVLSRRPARVVYELTVELPRPRDQLATREDPRFLAYRHDIFTLIRSQSLESEASIELAAGT
jgi:NitT/TauT family transport system ATP-binding protein